MRKLFILMCAMTIGTYSFANMAEIFETAAPIYGTQTVSIENPATLVNPPTSTTQTHPTSNHAYTANK